jgi:hypothetical protein
LKIINFEWLRNTYAPAYFFRKNWHEFYKTAKQMTHVFDKLNTEMTNVNKDAKKRTDVVLEHYQITMAAIAEIEKTYPWNKPN